MGASRARRLYVIEGACTISFVADVWELSEGDYADLPSGRFQFSVSHSCGVAIVSVYALPEQFWAENLKQGES